MTYVSGADTRETYVPDRTTTPTRGRHRSTYERAAVHAALDEALICHLGFVVDGAPVVLPTIHVRIAERLYLHGSTGARALRLAADGGLPVCVSVTIVDGLVLARSAFHHSMNYRSVVAHGTAHLVTDPAERARALDAIVDHVQPGRSAQCRPPTGKELAATAVLALDLERVSAKVRTGDPVDDPEDLAGPWWAGVVPVTVRRGTPAPSADLRPGVPGPPPAEALPTG
ncbi:MAG: pyridoxamine 5'-phosphate oxidase family protein [Actinomycetota bacterium]|nr:pyridoxamine 5'-phosphate oxidase family protein [Actinomycetota bacterium]